MIGEIEKGRGSPRPSDRLYERETREQAVKSQLALANGPDVVELHPQAAERYAAKVADIHAALAGGDAAGHEAIALVRELITRVRVIPTPKGQPIGLEIAGDLAALLNVNSEGTLVVSTTPASASSRTCAASPPIWCSPPGPHSSRPCEPDSPRLPSATAEATRPPTRPGMMEAAQGFRRLKAYRHLPSLQAALAEHASRHGQGSQVVPQRKAA